MIQQGHEQQYCHRQSKRRVNQRQHDTSDLHREHSASDDDRESGITNPLADETDHRDQVVKVIKQLDQAFHDNRLADYGQLWSAGFRITRVGIPVIEGRIIRLLRMGDRPMKQLPALSSEFILEKNYWRFSFRSFV